MGRKASFSPLRSAVSALLFGAAMVVWAGPNIIVLGLFSGKAVLTIDGERRVLSEGDISPEGVRLIQADSEGAVVEVEGRRERLALGTHIGSTFSAAKQREVRIWPDTGGMYTIDGSINGYSITFMVDTGATLVSMNSTEARRLGVDYLRDGRPAMLETASGREKAYRVNLDRISVGEIKVRNVPAVVLEGNLPSRTLLGMSFLDQLDMQRDGKALVLRSKW
ncbi:retropepsin-like aspartic protease family protein [Thiohalomonas denitrificans]|uniref:Aspartyl protease family protein n=1 Tax=Thiohalomonas denitrificans TaxID=415747 RepID=A0A1G5Q0T5_9GAMM|nr:TIGR02281 family clan AA aspartic protease [Thiohalomonas denitrificans]SCZ55070.1 aspartyl protease family protein [Thiohalomonas denitrificans]